MDNIKEKIKASIMLASYLDTLGFKNGEWEFNYNKNIKSKEDLKSVWLNIIHHFFSLGGFQNIDIQKWNSSDDTILLIATGKACLENKGTISYINEYKKVLPLLKKNKRASGFTTLESLQKITKTKNLNTLKYSCTMGGNGAAMRTSTIGIIYYKEQDVEILIEQSIIASRITHNYTRGFMAGIVTALFTSYAIRNIEPWKWSLKMMELVNTGLIDKIMKKTNILHKYNNTKNDFWNTWKQYNEIRLPQIKYKHPAVLFFNDKIKELINYTPGIINTVDGGYYYNSFGSSGVGAVIVAYDALLSSLSNYYDNNRLTLDKPTQIKYNWDSLVFFSTLHFGDNDTTGTIAGAWYGALRGFEYINPEKMKQLEFFTELNILSDNIVNKIL